MKTYRSRYSSEIGFSSQYLATSATEEVIARVAEGDADIVDAAVAAARDAFENGPWSTMDAG